MLSSSSDKSIADACAPKSSHPRAGDKWSDPSIAIGYLEKSLSKVAIANKYQYVKIEKFRSAFVQVVELKKGGYAKQRQVKKIRLWPSKLWMFFFEKNLSRSLNDR